MQVRSISTLKLIPARLKTRREFLRIQRNGLRFKGAFITLIVRHSREMAELGRFGLVTPKSIGKAHDRNLIKRRLRHIISLYPEILHQHDLILLALPNSQTASFDELIRDVSNSIQQILDRRRARNTRRSFLTSAPSLPGENDVH